MLITGGWDEDIKWSSAEIFDPSNPSLTCNLPNMTVARSYHAAVGRTVCGGGGDGLQTCETLDNRQWKVSHILQEERWIHVMWQSPSQGVMVMGSGGFSDTGKTTKRLEGNGNGWELQHDI